MRYLNTDQTYLSGERFEQLADFSFKPGLNIPNNAVIIFCKTDFINELLEKIRSLKQRYIIISHNSDIEINDTVAENLPANIIMWFAQNANVNYPRIQGIPIGIANSQWPHGDFSVIKNIASRNIAKDKLAYLCANITTNPLRRSKIYDMCIHKKFITVKGGHKLIDINEYLNDIASHKFTICPQGNGNDSHRVWEALYLGSYPVVEKSLALRYFEKLPIVFVDDFGQLDASTLEELYEKMRNSQWAYEMMDISYWEKRIRSFMK